MNDEEVINTIDKAIEKAVSVEWITLNAHIRREAVARTIFEAIQVAEREKWETQEKATALSFVQKHFPKAFTVILDEAKGVL